MPLQEAFVVCAELRGRNYTYYLSSQQLCESLPGCVAEPLRSLSFLICNREMKTYFIGLLCGLSEIMQLMVFGT